MGLADIFNINTILNAFLFVYIIQVLKVFYEVLLCKLLLNILPDVYITAHIRAINE